MKSSDFYALGLQNEFNMRNVGHIQKIRDYTHWYVNRTKYQHLGVELSFKADEIHVMVDEHNDAPIVRVIGANVTKEGFAEFMEELKRFYVLHNAGAKYNRIARSWAFKHQGRRYDDDDEFFRVRYLKLTAGDIGKTQRTQMHEYLKKKYYRQSLTFDELVILAQGLEDGKLKDSVIKEINEILNYERRAFIYNMRTKNSYLSKDEVQLFRDMDKRRYTRKQIWDASDSEIEDMIEYLEDFDIEFDEKIEVVQNQYYVYINELGFDIEELDANYKLLDVVKALEEVLDERIDFIQGKEYETTIEDYLSPARIWERMEEQAHRERHLTY